MPPPSARALLAFISASSALPATAQTLNLRERFPMTAPVPPRQAPAPAPRRAPWAGTTSLSATFGLGSPYGYLGLVVGHWFGEHLQLEFGGGWSGGFGPSVGTMVRAGFDPGNDSRLSLGVGLSTNFTDFEYPLFCTWDSEGNPRCPRGARVTSVGSSNPLWLNVELSEDLRIAPRVGGRVALGLGFLLNPGVFPAAAGCEPTTGSTPCDAGLNGGVFWLLYFRADVSWVTNPTR